MKRWHIGPRSLTQHTRSPSEPKDSTFFSAAAESKMVTPAALSSGKRFCPFLGPFLIMIGSDMVNDLSFR